MTRLPDSGPLVSIVMTLMFTHGRALESIASWTVGQTFPRRLIELIVVSDGSDPVLEKEVQRLFSHDDILIRVQSENEMQLIDVGATRAQAPWILVTEPHVIADEQCIEKLIDYLGTTGLDGACVRTIPTDQNNWIEYVEQRMYCEDFEVWSRDGDWRKFTKRGTIIRRSAYEAVNGLDYAYLRYSEMTLAAKLHQQGFRLGFASEARITHVNTTKLRDLLDYVWEYRQQKWLHSKNNPVLAQVSASSDGCTDLLVDRTLTVCVYRALLFALNRMGTNYGTNFATTMLKAATGISLQQWFGRLLVASNFAWRTGSLDSSLPSHGALAMLVFMHS